MSETTTQQSDQTTEAPENSAQNSPQAERSPGESIEELKKKIQAQDDKYLRLMAEFDNFKRRTSREYDRMVEAANEKIMLELIEVREDFSRALAAATSADKEGFAKGIDLVFQRFDQVLTRNGLEPYGAVGEEFNAELHDAMMKLPHKDIPVDHISEVFEKGYRVKSRIVRHAKVIVSAGSETAPEA